MNYWYVFWQFASGLRKLEISCQMKSIYNAKSQEMLSQPSCRRCPKWNARITQTIGPANDLQAAAKIPVSLIEPFTHVIIQIIAVIKQQIIKAFRNATPTHKGVLEYLTRRDVCCSCTTIICRYLFYVSYSVS